jgi:hypothetical protein
MSLGTFGKLLIGDVIILSRFEDLSIMIFSDGANGSQERNMWVEEDTLQGHTNWFTMLLMLRRLGSQSRTLLVFPHPANPKDTVPQSRLCFPGRIST